MKNIAFTYRFQMSSLFRCSVCQTVIIGLKTFVSMAKIGLNNHSFSDVKLPSHQIKQKPYSRYVLQTMPTHPINCNTIVRILFFIPHISAVAQGSLFINFSSTCQFSALFHSLELHKLFSVWVH